MTSAALRVRQVSALPTIEEASAARAIDPRQVGSREADGDVKSEPDTSDFGQLVIDHDMFRLSNTPASVRYTPAAEGMAGVAMPTQMRPQLLLKAIVGGPPWQAMVDGMPGSPSIVVRAGQVVGALTVKAVGRDTVVVQGMDTTWKLTLRGARP